MAVRIWSAVDAKVVRPGGKIRWRVGVAGEDGTPVEALRLNVAATGKVRARQTKLETGADGTAIVELATGPGWERAGIVVQHGSNKWQGRVYVTGVDITLPQGFVLAPEDEDLLRMLFWDKVEVQIIRQFGSGQSGNRVFQVRAFDDQGGFLTQVVKVGIRDEIVQEGENYKLFQNRLANAAPVSGTAEAGVQAAIIYGDASATAALGPVIPLAEYFLSARNGHSELQAVLYSILGRGLRCVHGAFQVKNLSPRQVVGKWFPENLVVSLGTETDCTGVFPSDESRPCPAGGSELTPREVERSAGEHDDLKPGTVALLRGFRIGKLQTTDLNLEDEDAKRHRIKVRFDGANISGIATGQVVDVVGQVVTDRTTRLAFAVRHCLDAHGLQVQPNGWYSRDRENYPDPVGLLPLVLDSRQDMAWATIHGDLHWENIMAESPSNWWLIDYGLTREGVVLFDFVKLETYLRMNVVAEDPGITPDEVLAFEADLLDNPFGVLRPKRHTRNILNKAATAIRSIRRLAQPYMLNGFSAYRDLLFCYAMATAKYYPTEDRWIENGTDVKASDKMQSASRRTFFVLAMALNLGRGIESDRVLRKFPEIQLSFVPMGSVLEPKQEQIVLDVGNRCETCMIDHHSIKDGEPRSTAGLVFAHPRLIEDCEAAKSPEKATWIIHEHPDFDAVSSLLLAWHLATCGFFPPGADQLQRYATLVDMGNDFLERSAFPARTPYALFAATIGSVPEIYQSCDDDRERVRCAWPVITFLCQSEALGLHALARNECPHEHPFWDLKIDNDEDLFWRSDFRKAKKEANVQLPIAGRMTPVRLLAVTAPSSLLFKVWARRNEYPLTVVLWITPEAPDNFAIISVPAAYTNALKGLGMALEAAETAKRSSMSGKQRPGPPRWPDVDNNDPWYDGRSAAHAYTIVAAPRMGTVLDMTEILEIVKSPSWHQAARAAEA